MQNSRMYNVKISDEVKGAFCVIIAGICWGLIGLSTKKLSTIGVMSEQITWIRNLIAMLGMAVVIVVSDYKKFVIKIKDVWLFLGTGICSIVFFNICYFRAIETSTMSMAAVLLYTAPCFVMVMSAVFFHEKVTKQKIIAVVFAIAGCILCTGVFTETGSMNGTGILYGLGSGIGYALYSIFGAVALKKYHTFTVTFYTFFFAALSLTPFVNASALTGLIINNSKGIFFSILLGVFSTLVPFICYTKGLTYLEAGKASVMAFVEPLVATICGIAIFHEELTGALAIGIVLLFCSVILLNIRHLPFLDSL